MPANDKLTALHDRLSEQVEALVDSQDWQAFLTVAARFHRYSANNLFLILSQMPTATRVAGYRRWLSLGRQVRRGETGLAILAPCVSRARAVDEAEADERPEVVRILRGFRVAHVFDISQTDGDDLADVRPALLAGEAPEGLWDALAAQVADAGYRLERGECGGANGRTNFVTRTVTVRDDVDEAQAVKTLVHELAHVRLHDPAEAHHHRGVAEVEAESVAYVVCSAAGLTSADYSLPYVARWADGDPAVVRRTAERVVTTAHAVLTAAGLADADTEAVSA